MSYERKMLEDLKMPTQKEVEQALLKSLFNNNGTIKEFGVGEKIVEDIANDFGLNEEQRTSYLETIYRKENRVKRSYLWHRLLFRAADSLAKEKLVSRPTQTALLTNNKEWMLTENGYNRALEILNIPLAQKEILPTKSYEVQKIVERIYKQERPQNYNPFENKKTVQITREAKFRNRAFKQAVKEAYDFKCAVCGMKICSPNTLQWEVEAVHIVPHSKNGKDDLLNGLALCRLHHWAFDVGWFTLGDNFNILGSRKIKDLSAEFGKLGDYDFIKQLLNENLIISLPKEQAIHPHPNAIKWHRENIFYR
ncbi:MAG TPA: HNH endonuclease [Anaerolineales bacterium]|nr:HNH endonuclease [Anaerolineales bacterium]